MESGAYGASLAGGSFDLLGFVKQPQTVVRLLSWLCAIVVFATITAEGYVNPDKDPQEKCMFNANDSACSYAVGIGVLAFLACVAFLVLDVYLHQTSNAKERKMIVMADLIFSGAWTFLWFVCFCLLANQWSHTIETDHFPADAARAAIAFSFFSIACWAVLAYFSLLRYQQGVTELSSSYTDPAQDHSTPYPPQGYQQSPFGQNQMPGGTEYTPPNY
ncbi:synaptogyrin-2a [Alosa sapidissima]|uniref:synaptogyrin-2a n=1 Tax=Alosa sapidissima TaxID=34773 RepID=UPI001C0A43A0|nr:synaptogyrin-2a [Alosa sapidissima]XP_041942035.1 synaptogyrin-2a [Alosa sapidissima]